MALQRGLLSPFWGSTCPRAIHGCLVRLLMQRSGSVCIALRLAQQKHAMQVAEGFLPCRYSDICS